MANSVVYSFIASDRYSAVARRVRRTTNKVGRSFRGMALDAKKTNVVLGRTKRAMRKVGLAGAVAGAASLKAFGDLETGVTNVLTLMDDDAAIKKWQGSVEGAARGAMMMGFGTKDATKALFDTVSGLGANEKAFKTFEVAQKLALGGVTELRVATDGITSIMNAYGKETTDANSVANAFFTSQKKGKTTVAELAANVGKAAPQAFKLGVGYKELTALGAELTLGGLSTEDAFTGLRGIFMALQKPGAQAAKTLHRLKVPFGVTAVKAAGLTEVLRRLAMAVKEDEDALAFAIPEARALTAVSTLTEERLANIGGTVRLVNKDIRDNTGLTKAAAMQQATFNQQMARTWGAVKVLAAMIGESLAPTVGKIANGIIGLIKGLIGLKAATKGFLAKIAGGVAILAGIAAAVGTVMVLLGKGAIVAGVIAAAFGAIPLLIAAGVVALIAAIAFFIQKSDMIKEKLGSVKKKVLGFFGGGGGEELDVSGTAETKNTSKTEIEMNVNAPKGVIQSIKSKTTGDTSGLSLGVNMAESLP